MWRLNEFSEFMNTVKASDQSSLDRLYHHALNLGNMEKFDDDFTIVEIDFG